METPSKKHGYVRYFKYIALSAYVFMKTGSYDLAICVPAAILGLSNGVSEYKKKHDKTNKVD